MSTCNHVSLIIIKDGVFCELCGQEILGQQYLLNFGGESNCEQVEWIVDNHVRHHVTNRLCKHERTSYTQHSHRPTQPT